MKTLLPIFALLLLTSCAEMNTTLVNPETKEWRACQNSGWGWLGTPIAIAQHNECVKRMKAQGYVEGGEAPAGDGSAPIKIILDSDPQGANILAGVDPDNMVPIAITPATIDHPRPSAKQFWQAECYKARKENYYDSEVVCLGRTEQDRVVTLSLEPIRAASALVE